MSTLKQHKNNIFLQYQRLFKDRITKLIISYGKFCNCSVLDRLFSSTECGFNWWRVCNVIGIIYSILILMMRSSNMLIGGFDIYTLNYIFTLELLRSPYCRISHIYLLIAVEILSISRIMDF